MLAKRRIGINVLEAARRRIRYTFDHFEKVYLSFSGGKDSSVMMHLVMDEAVRRKRKVGVLIVDLEAQYALTIKHVCDMVNYYQQHIELFWCCLPIKLRNAVSNYEPVWCAWDPDKQDSWVREKPQGKGVITDSSFFPFFKDRMEFEEFIALFAEWYAGDALTAACVAIRTDESLNRFRTIAVWDKEMHFGKRWTTQVSDNCYNVYPIYDWHVKDIWRYHAQFPDKLHNEIYDRMHLAGMSPSQMRLCQPYGDDQRRGLWLFHICEPQTWSKIVARVNGANSGATYIEEHGNITGYLKISCPPGHTWKSFCQLLLRSMPEVTREHYLKRFRTWLKGWKARGYADGIPDEAPRCLEKKYWAPSWRRLCKVLLRNDWWCKGLGMQQPKSEAYTKWRQSRKQLAA